MVRNVLFTFFIGVLFMSLIYVQNSSYAFDNKEDMSAEIVDTLSDCKEPLMIRVKIIKVNNKTDQCLARVLSETYRGRMIVLDSCYNLKKGDDIMGMFCDDEFSVVKDSKHLHK